MTKPALLVHPPLGFFEARLVDYDVVHWPTDRKDVGAALIASQYSEEAWIAAHRELYERILRSPD